MLKNDQLILRIAPGVAGDPDAAGTVPVVHRFGGPGEAFAGAHCCVLQAAALDWYTSRVPKAMPVRSSPPCGNRESRRGRKSFGGESNNAGTVRPTNHFVGATVAAHGPTRRRFLASGAASATLGSLGLAAAPYLSRAADRPSLTHGLQSGDVSTDSGVVWARADRPARMLVEASTTESFSTIVNATFADALPESDFTAKVLLEDLPAGEHIFYRISLQDIASPTIIGEAQVGRFRTAPMDRRSISFTWSGDAAGQGWGIDVSRGGMRTFRTIRDNRPDFFIHSGDSIYADCTIPREIKLPNGEIWRNLVTEEKSEIAQTLNPVSRQLQIQSARRQRARLQCRGADPRAVG